MSKYKLSYTAKEIDAKLGAKPDWNENDPNSPNYIANRTHWIEEGAAETYTANLFSTSVMYTNPGDFVSNDVLGNFLPDTATQLTVTINNTSHYTLNVYKSKNSTHFIAGTVPDDIAGTYGYTALELEPIRAEGMFEHESIYWLGLVGDFANNRYDIYTRVPVADDIISCDIDISYSAIAATGRVIHKIDDMFIPDTIARTSQLAAAGGGKYEQPCWRKTGYTYNTYKTEFSKQPLTQDIVLANALDAAITATSVSIQYATSATISGNSVTLNNPYSVLIGETGAPAYYTIATSSDSAVSVSGSINILYSRLNALARQSTGVYIKTNLSDKIYHVYIPSTTATAFYGTSSAWSSGNYTDLKITGGPLAQMVGINSGVFEEVEVIDQVIDTYANVNELVYADARDAYTEGDNGQGLIYTYLGIPSEVVPDNDKFTQHCWHKEGYSVLQWNKTVTPLTSTKALLNSATNRVYLFVGTDMTVNNGNIEFVNERVFELGYTTGWSNVGAVSGTIITVYSDSEGTISSAADMVTLINNMAVSGVYVSISDSSSVFPEVVYELNAKGQLTHTYTSIMSAEVLNLVAVNSVYPSTVTITISGYDDTYVGINEYVYSHNANAYTEGDNGEGLIYTYLGIPSNNPGGLYNQHCWSRKGYAYTTWNITKTQYNSSSLPSTLLLTPIVTSPTIGELSIGTGLSSIDGEWVLENKRSFLYGYTTSGTGYDIIYTIAITYDSGGSIGTVSGIVDLINSMITSYGGVYIIGGNSIDGRAHYVDRSGQVVYGTVNAPTTYGLVLQGFYTPQYGTTYPYYITKTEGTYVDTYLGIDDIVYSSSRNAFEEGDNGEGLIYKYLGVPSEYVPLCGTKIQSGSYIGTGSNGASNPNSLTFDFKPKLIFIDGYYSASHYHAEFNTALLSSSFRSGVATVNNTTSSLSGKPLSARMIGNTLSWYYSDSSLQLNASSTEYHWIAIG